MARLRGGLREGLGGRLLPWLAVIALCAFVYSSTFTIGYLVDDYFQLAAVEGRFGPHRGPFSNYTFAFSDPEAIDAHRRRGSLPWWTTDDWRFGMLRPLSSLTIELDYRLFPRHPFLSHVHGFLWFAAMLWAAQRLMHRLLIDRGDPGRSPPAPRWVAAVALLAFAIDESSGYALMWIANRCAFVSATFALLAIEAHLRWRGSDDPRTRVRGWRLEWLWWALAFAGGEYALCGAAYVLAYELVAPPEGRGTPSVRFAGLLPAASCAGVFVIAYLLSGLSSMGLAEYADPFRETGRFLAELGHKLPRLAAETWTSLPANDRSLLVRASEYERLRGWLGDEGLGVLDDLWRHAGLSSAALLSLAALLLATARHLDPDLRRDAAWLTLGSLLGLLPLASTLPQARLLVIPGLGVAGAIGLALAQVARGVHTPRAWRFTLPLASATLLLSLDVVVESVAQHRAVGRIHDLQRDFERMWPAPALARQLGSEHHVVVLSQPEFITTVHGYGISSVHLPTMPATWHTLAYGSRPYFLERSGPRELTLTAIGSGIYTERDERSFRRASEAFGLGDRVDVGLFEAEMVRMHPHGGVLVVRFRFDRPLDHPSLVFLATSERGLVSVDLPPVGGRALIPLARFPTRPDQQ